MFFVCYYAGKYKAYSDIYEKVLNEHVKRHFEEEFKDDIKNKINKGQKQMEVKFNAGDMCAIPDGCKATIKDGVVIFEKEEIVQDFKDGDILVTTIGKKRRNAFIYKGTDKNGFHSYYAGINADGLLSVNDSSNSRWGCYDLSYATEEEKQLFFDKMKEQGLKWNAEEKKVEKIRWRAKKGEEYRFMNTDFTTVCTTELGDDVDTNRYDALNYFRTKEQAEEAAKRIKEVLCNYHEEIGE